ncbi:hypothetical protein F3Y22_tig00117016pilonHSYRG00761 [Hibiscus syriacus]|uniref:Uncharacterized protein n=1 Tax=Hibiscus syriacus TaxID=106335 RepID=A0A6A2XHT7_HIBSY|nr:hypothetical protein F3Y22_tig00117016pilonHSYRG00761 [Hibiscus syriacus]
MAALAPTPLLKHPLSSSPKVFDSRVQSGEIQPTQFRFLGLFQLPAGTSFYRTGEVSGQLERTGKRVGHVCWDDNDVINGKPTGVVGVSIGYMSTYEDAKLLHEMEHRSFQHK